MPINLNNPDLDEQLNRLAGQQGARVSRHSLAEAMIRSGIERCNQSGNPMAWMFPAVPQHPTAEAQANADQSPSIRGNQPNDPAQPENDMNPAASGA